MSFRTVCGVAVAAMWLGGLSGAATSLAARQQPEELPEGKGRDILEAACTSCHELDEVTKLRGQYGKEEWRGVVKMMVDYGAQVTTKDADVLVDYLDQHLGKRK